MSYKITKIEITHEECPKGYEGVHGIFTPRVQGIHWTLTGMQIECITNHCPACGEKLPTLGTVTQEAGKDTITIIGGNHE